MYREVTAAACTALLTTFALTAAMRSFALTHGVLDVPNERSSHDAPTPRGGGVAIVVTTSIALVALAWFGALGRSLFWALLGGGVVVSSIGFLDDRRRVSAGVRLVAHVGAALWAVMLLGGFSSLRVGAQIVHLGWSGNVLALLGIVWAVNLFNFMDGIDGLAASEAVFVAWGAVLVYLIGTFSTLAPVAVIFGAACLGFLLWNWPPARIFMGDVGSGYAGYVIILLALAAARENPVGLWLWLILGGVFFADATVTLLRRLLRGERVYEAHRSHAYQWLARRWGSHRKVTLAVLAVNLVWLLPCAVSAAAFPGYAALLVVVALAPLAVLAVALGAGRAETSTSA